VYTVRIMAWTEKKISLKKTETTLLGYLSEYCSWKHYFKYNHFDRLVRKILYI